MLQGLISPKVNYSTSSGIYWVILKMKLDLIRIGGNWWGGGPCQFCNFSYLVFHKAGHGFGV
jgi:hypothetical protein